MLAGLKPLARFVEDKLGKKGKADLKGSLMAIAIVFIVLYILVIVLGNLIPVMDQAVNDTSPLASAKTSLTQNTQTFFTIAALVGVIGVAMLIINLLT